jgi:hypothetical protein
MVWLSALNRREAGYRALNRREADELIMVSVPRMGHNGEGGGINT